jgi:hypothetical protein
MVDQYKKVKEFVRVAQEEGATLVCGGKRPDVSPSLAFSLHIFESIPFIVDSYRFGSYHGICWIKDA